MTLEQLEEFAKEVYGNIGEEILDDILQELIDQEGWHPDTTLREAMCSHAKYLENKLTMNEEN